jgi:capsule biosynthesis phosphatase
MNPEAYDSKLVVDIDGTLCPLKKEGESYADLIPDSRMVNALKRWRDKGFKIVFFTARNMRTYEGNMGAINKHTAPVIIKWLDKHGIEYDEIIFGKPWPGPEGFYVDDKTIRPSELLTRTDDEISALINENLPEKQ